MSAAAKKLIEVKRGSIGEGQLASVHTSAGGVSVTRDNGVSYGPPSMTSTAGELSRDVGYVAGPVTILGRATLRISSSRADPAHTLIIPSGVTRDVIMECSTNPITWQSATNGTYGGLDAAKFFRIGVEGFRQPHLK